MNSSQHQKALANLLNGDPDIQQWADILPALRALFEALDNNLTYLDDHGDLNTLLESITDKSDPLHHVTILLHQMGIVQYSDSHLARIPPPNKK